MLVPGSSADEPALLLDGFNSLDVALTGRYSQPMPAAIFVAAVSRTTGRAFVHHLTRDDDIPATSLGAGAAPTIVRIDPGGPSTAGISDSSHFQVDLARHLGLPRAAGVFDVFLWAEGVVSDMASASKPAEPGTSLGRETHSRPDSIARVRAIPRSEPLALTMATRQGQPVLVGSTGESRVTVIAHVVESMRPAWTILQTPGDDSTGVAFELDVAALLPGIDAEQRVIAFAVAGGARSAPVDSGPLP